MQDKEQEKGKRGRIDEMLLGVNREDLPRISLEGAEIVRRQYLSHIKEAIATVRPDGIAFNNSCIVKMVDTVYIHLMVDRGKKLLIIRACDEYDRDGQRWCSEKDDVRKSRKITGRPFSEKLYRLMGWSKGYYYKICGSPALRENTEDELLFVFELEEAERFPMTAKGRKAAGVSDEELSEEELSKLNEEEKARAEEALEKGKKSPKNKKKSRYPESWGKDTFGPLAEEHVDRVRVGRVDGLELSGEGDFTTRLPEKE